MASNKKPIISFKDEKEFLQVAKEWQDRLFLSDWLIKFKLINNTNVGKTPDGNDELGVCMYDSLNKNAVIKVANGDGVIAEFTLVHELLHCALEYGASDNIGEDYDSLELFYARTIHTRLNQMAKSLILAKYPNIDKDFFRIELDAYDRHMTEKESETSPCTCNPCAARKR